MPVTPTNGSMFRLRFLRLRLILLVLPLLAQVYLFVRIRRAILASGRSDRLKRHAIRLVGVAIALLFASLRSFAGRRPDTL